MVEAFAMEAHTRANTIAVALRGLHSSRGELQSASATGQSARGYVPTGSVGGSAAPRAGRGVCEGERRPSRLHALRMVYLRGGQVQTSRSFVDELLNLPYALYAFVCFFFQTLIDVRRRPPHTPPHHHR